VRRRLLLLLLLLALLPVAAGCGASSDEPRSGGGPAEVGDATSVVREPTSSTGSPSTESTSTTAAGPSRPTAFTTRAADAANELKAAWEVGDRPRALAIAPGDVVEALFLVPPAGFEIYGCDTGEFDTSTCNFRNRSTGVYIPVTMVRSEQGWQVDTIYVGD
jgi:hypothetical protein